ncbi:unnamed protein product [Sphenostylis stenocarpa]|uniref:Fe2OG dioxygenase domain-containing protein n=1 Tax=Sphenostylis stenocarpa TaxID=92480 RepID=A0AA86VZ91_9FABA|nr:unnamed protein product [Sphenostylis stenocarpa]
MTVQELIKKPLTSVPQCYVNQPQNHQPNSSVEDESFSHAIPTISLKKLTHVESTQTEQERLNSACKDCGFVQLVEHGINPLVLKTLKEEIEGFFRLPLEEKMKYKIRAGDVEGYGAPILSNKDQKLDWADRVYMITNPLSRRKPYLLPELPSSLRSILEVYIVELQNIAMTLLGVLGRALKIERRELEVFEDGMQSMRMTYYPPCPEPEKVMGITAHSDVAGITILNQLNGVNGLQIKKHGIWIPVNVSPDALIVNIGDLLEVCSRLLHI